MFFVFLIIALISTPKHKEDDDSSDLNATSNDTAIDELLRPSIAYYASNRDKVAIDKTGQLKEKW